VHGLGDEPALQVRGLGVRYGGVEALRDVDLSVDAGELVALVGPNGAGKTSLLRAVLGLVPASGRVVVHARRCAFVPQRQDVDLDFPITAEQVALAGRRPFRRLWARPGADDRRAARRALARVGLDGFERRTLAELSGGQLQRTFLARALAQEADVLLLDEPLAGVDATTSGALLDLFERLARDGAALLVSTHDLPVVRRRFARCVALRGRVVGDGPPGAVLSPDGLERLYVHA
jgi:ABC-type Mn2+/Zn2+ transport system ATPase subunit